MEKHSNLAELESTFQTILEDRMDGVPVLNDRLQVKTIGFVQWNNYQFGILITPWFMNLILLPEQEGDQNQAKVGSKQTHIFPSGPYEFIVGFEDGLGVYLSCSLFSPMFEFEEQAVAELTAEEALSAIMDDANLDVESQAKSKEIEQIWAGEKPMPDKTDSLFTNKEKIADKRTLSERISEPTSRRDFLRGKVFTEDADK
ncbi:MAG: [NiFe]-hydrogenase assembly chaperone HybE [Methylophaga sp.]|nr:[NiFe]-hydrogenase assembly chaperone HybE [Methylophaga sp.]